MDVHALARGLLQMRGSKQSIHPVFVRHDLNVNTQEFKQKVHELSRSIPETHAMEVKKCEQSMMDKLLPGILDVGQRIHKFLETRSIVWEFMWFVPTFSWYSSARHWVPSQFLHLYSQKINTQVWIMLLFWGCQMQKVTQKITAVTRRKAYGDWWRFSSIQSLQKHKILVLAVLHQSIFSNNCCCEGIFAYFPHPWLIAKKNMCRLFGTCFPPLRKARCFYLGIVTKRVLSVTPRMAGDQNDLPKYICTITPNSTFKLTNSAESLPKKASPITIPKLAAFFRTSWRMGFRAPRSSFDLDLRGLLRQKRTSKRTTRNSGIVAEVSQDKQLSEKLLPNLHAACESVEAGRVGVELVEWPSETGWHTCSFTCWIRRVGPSQLIDHGKTLEILANNSVAGLIESDDERDWQTTCLWVGLIQCYDILNPAYSIRDFIYIGGLTCQNSYSSCWIARPPDGGVPAECFMAHARNWYLPIRSNVVMASVLRSNDDRKHSCWAVYPSI